jgi:GDPmannose 4,6-dehydratase
MTNNYREGYKLFASCGILFNHESPRRGEIFVTRKITRAIADILARKQTKLYLGNLDAKRDWGFAPEYAEAMWRILQNQESADYVIGTGEAHPVREFVEESFDYAGLNSKSYVEIDERYFRPTEVDELVADASKATREIGWNPKVKFHDLVKIMVDAELRRVGLKPPGDGDKLLRKNFPTRWWKID